VGSCGDSGPYALSSAVNDGVETADNALCPDTLSDGATRRANGAGSVDKRFGGGVNSASDQASGLSDSAASLPKAFDVEIGRAHV
jgi:hypothetical protein